MTSTLKMPEPTAWQNNINFCMQYNGANIVAVDYNSPQWTKLYTVAALRDVLEQAAQRLERITGTSPQSALGLAGIHAGADIIRAMIKEIK